MYIVNMAVICIEHSLVADTFTSETSVLSIVARLIAKVLFMLFFIDNTV